jgi:hypothetical protein
MFTITVESTLIEITKISLKSVTNNSGSLIRINLYGAMYAQESQRPPQPFPSTWDYIFNKTCLKQKTRLIQMPTKAGKYPYLGKQRVLGRWNVRELPLPARDANCESKKYLRLLSKTYKHLHSNTSQCDGAHPSCLKCQDLGAVCEYIVPSKPMPFGKNHYLKALEDRLQNWKVI